MGNGLGLSACTCLCRSGVSSNCKPTPSIFSGRGFVIIFAFLRIDRWSAKWRKEEEERGER